MAASKSRRRMAKNNPQRYQRIRYEAMLRDGFCCVECGTDEHVTPHHIVPFHDGGVHEASNIEALCDQCHGKRHDCPTWADGSPQLQIVWVPNKVAAMLASQGVLVAREEVCA